MPNSVRLVASSVSGTSVLQLARLLVIISTNALNFVSAMDMLEVLTATAAGNFESSCRRAHMAENGFVQTVSNVLILTRFS